MTKTDSKTPNKKTAAKKVVKKTAAKKPAVKKKTKSAPAKKPAAKKTAHKISAKPATKFIVSHEQRFYMVSEAAYFRSLEFQTASSIENWFEAEKSINLICKIH